MKVTGFTFIRNALKFDYPVREAIESVLPLCDEFIVAVGKSEDDTRQLIASIDPHKIKIIDTVWDDSLREGGQVLAMETNKALEAISPDSDWAFYIQGDEVLHEKYLQPVRQAMEQYKDYPEVEGLLFEYLHFYGSYDYTGSSPKWYAHEIRIIRPGRTVYSYKDAQGFRKGNNEKLAVKKIPACIYHYGWVKEPAAMQEKQKQFNKYWHTDEWVEKHVSPADRYEYSSLNSLSIFKGTHPAVMQERIQNKNWKFEYDISFTREPFKDKLKKFLKKYLGLDFSYRNYRVV